MNQSLFEYQIYVTVWIILWLDEMNVTYFHHFQFEVFLPVNFPHLQDQLNKLLNRQLFLQYFQPVRILNYGLISISLSIFMMKNILYDVRERKYWGLYLSPCRPSRGKKWRGPWGAWSLFIICWMVLVNSVIVFVVLHVWFSVWMQPLDLLRNTYHVRLWYLQTKWSRKRFILDLWRIRSPTSTFSDLSCSPRLVEELSGLSELFLVSELVLIAVTFLSSTDDQSFLCLTNYCLVTKRLKSKCYDLFKPDEI